MLEFSEQKDALTEKIIGCAIEVHRQLGPGLLESTYESALCVELELAGLKFQRQLIYPISYKGRVIGEHRIDLIVERAVILDNVIAPAPTVNAPRLLIVASPDMATAVAILELFPTNM